VKPEIDRAAAATAKVHFTRVRTDFTSDSKSYSA